MEKYNVFQQPFEDVVVSTNTGPYITQVSIPMFTFDQSDVASSPVSSLRLSSVYSGSFLQHRFGIHNTVTKGDEVEPLPKNCCSHSLTPENSVITI